MNRKKLLDVLSCASKAVKGNGELNIRVRNGQMDVSAASQNLSICATLEADCEDIETAVKASAAIQAVSTLPDEEIRLRPSGDGIQVAGSKCHVTLPGTEYRDMRRTAEYSSQVITRGLGPFVRQVIHSLDNTGYAPMMSTIQLKVCGDGGFQITALDGKRYSIRNTATKGSKLEGEFLVYGRELNEALKLVGDEEVAIYCPKDENFIRLKGDDVDIQISLFSGKYYNLDSLRSAKLPLRLSVNRKEMLRALELTRLVSTDALVDFSAERVTVCGESLSGESAMEVPAKSRGLEDGRVVKTAFKATILKEALESIDSDLVTIHFKDALNQFCITDGRNAIEMCLPARKKH